MERNTISLFWMIFMHQFINEGRILIKVLLKYTPISAGAPIFEHKQYKGLLSFECSTMHVIGYMPYNPRKFIINYQFDGIFITIHNFNYFA